MPITDTYQQVTTTINLRCSCHRELDLTQLSQPLFPDFIIDFITGVLTQLFIECYALVPKLHAFFYNFLLALTQTLIIIAKLLFLKNRLPLLASRIVLPPYAHGLFLAALLIENGSKCFPRLVYQAIILSLTNTVKVFFVQ